MRRAGLAVCVSVGRYGGVYAHFSRTSWRITLGWFALTIVFMELDDVLSLGTREALRRTKEATPCAT